MYRCEESEIKTDILVGDSTTLINRQIGRITNFQFCCWRGELVTATDASEDLTALVNVLGDLFTTI